MLAKLRHWPLAVAFLQEGCLSVYLWKTGSGQWGAGFTDHVPWPASDSAAPLEWQPNSGTSRVLGSHLLTPWYVLEFASIFWGILVLNLENQCLPVLVSIARSFLWRSSSFHGTWAAFLERNTVTLYEVQNTACICLCRNDWNTSTQLVVLTLTDCSQSLKDWKWNAVPETGRPF